MDIIDILLAQSGAAGEGSSGVDEVARALARKASSNAERALHPNIEDFDTTEAIGKLLNEIAIEKNYKDTGSNEDGSMTQKAITALFNELSERIVNSSGTNLGPENEGAIVVVGADGEPTVGSIDEASLIRTQVLTDTYQAVDTIGIEIDYENRSFSRIQDARGLSAGQDFNTYPMYGGINRCLVDDNGQIIAFYGDETYIDNFSTGYQTMVYIPKFYYARLPLELNGNTIKKEIIMITAVNQSGFKLHPAFINDNGEEVDYFLYPAYEGCAFDTSANAYNRTDTAVNFSEDKLSSVTDAKPISGQRSELTKNNAERLAQNRGQNWHITSIQANSAIQMLMLIEFCSFNGQNSIGSGISNITTVAGVNCASYTGSTADLGNQTGVAASTTNERNGIDYVYTDNGQCAINYRGIENPWGNIWTLIGNIEIRGNGLNKGGIPFIKVNNEYKSAGFTLPNNSNWISGFGYGNTDLDWLFIPSETENANSALPVGDYVWISSNLSGINGAVMGGHWSFKENDGMFYYGFDKSSQYSDRTYSARVMFIPSKNSTYEQNIALWHEMRG